MTGLRATALLLLLTTVLHGCKKELDAPPDRILPVGSVLTVAELRALYVNQPVRFSEPRSVYAVVTADEQSGNLYRNIFVQDHTGAIQLRLRNPGGLYQGDSVRIYLPGTVLSIFSGMMQLDSVDVDNNVVKQATLVQKTPEPVTISQITPAMQARLVRLDSVEFLAGELGNSYADAVTQQTVNRTLTDCDGNTVIVRTSGYANFANQQLPLGNGSFVAVVGQFNNDMQLFIRDISEVQLGGERCDGSSGTCDPIDALSEDFQGTTSGSDLALTCWTNFAEVGTRRWRAWADGGNLYAEGRCFQSGNPTDIHWLITPPVNYVPGRTLSFRSQRGFGVAGHDPFGLFISTDYNSATPASATWTPVMSTYAVPSTANSVWVPSGNIDLEPYLPQGYNGTFVIGFRYSGSVNAGTTTNFRIDDIVIQ